MTRKKTVGVVILLIIVGGSLYWISPPRPTFPSSWQHVRSGMGRAEIIAAIGAQPHADLRSEKGFDVYVHEPNGREYWSMMIYYDTDSLAARSVSFNFIDRNNGLRHLNVHDPGARFRSKYAE